LKKKGARRPPNDFITLYHYFTTNGRNPVKKDNKRIQINRGEKKAIDCILNGKPRKGFHQFDPGDRGKLSIWQTMEQLVSLDPMLFKTLSSSTEGPQSYSNEYCHHFYESDLMLQFHFYYAQLVYGIGEVDPTSLSKKLKMFCCDGRHSVYCSAIWEQVRHYVMFDMISELDLVPIGIHSEAFLMTQQIAEGDDPDRYLSPPNP
jgi:hypothetical protein